MGDRRRIFELLLQCASLARFWRGAPTVFILCSRSRRTRPLRPHSQPHHIYIYICASPSASQHAPLVTASPCEGARFYGVVIIWAIMKVMPRVLLMLRVGGAGVLTRIYGAWASTAARGVMGSKLNNSTSNRQSSTCLFCLARRTTSAMCRGRRAGNTTTTCCHSRTQPSCSQSQHAGVEHVS